MLVFFGWHRWVAFWIELLLLLGWKFSKMYILFFYYWWSTLYWLNFGHFCPLTRSITVQLQIEELSRRLRSNDLGISPNPEDRLAFLHLVPPDQVTESHPAGLWHPVSAHPWPGWAAPGSIHSTKLKYPPGFSPLHFSYLSLYLIQHFCCLLSDNIINPSIRPLGGLVRALGFRHYRICLGMC